MGNMGHQASRTRGRGEHPPAAQDGSRLMSSRYGGAAGRDGYAAVDVCCLRSGGARAAIIITGGADFAHVLAERTACVPEAAPYRPGPVLPARTAAPSRRSRHRRDTAPRRHRRLRGPGSKRPRRTRSPHPRRVRGPGHRRSQDVLPHRHPRRTGTTRKLRPAALRHRRRNPAAPGCGDSRGHGRCRTGFPTRCGEQTPSPAAPAPSHDAFRHGISQPPSAARHRNPHPAIPGSGHDATARGTLAAAARHLPSLFRSLPASAEGLFVDSVRRARSPGTARHLTIH